MKHLSVDIETFSDNDIVKGGVFKYVDAPNFNILLFAYSVDFGPVQIVDLANGETLPQDVIDALNAPSVIKHAYNAAFEITCLNKAGYTTPVDQWRCTMLHGLYLGYPAGLAALGKALLLPDDKKKLATGKALIRYFCIPCKATRSNGQRTRNLPHHDMAKWKLFKEYCVQDVVTEMEDYKRLSAFPVPDFVQAQWVTDYKMNLRGIAVDTELINGALAIDDEEKTELTHKAMELTGLDNPNSRNQLLAWLNDNTNVSMDTLTKSSVADALGIADDMAKTVLSIRSKLSKSSVTKYKAMVSAMCADNRVRGLLQFYGANRTGRWAGRLVQVQNLPRNYIEPLDVARNRVKAGDRVGLSILYGDVSDTLSQLIRTAFIAPEGYSLVVTDFSAIEARVIAWLSGEQWRQDVFAEGGDIYCASASAMFHVPVEKHGVNGHLRQKGKVAELALGYQGGPNALIAMGALKMGLTEEELPDIVAKWRMASPHIRTFWYACEDAAIRAVRDAEVVHIPHGITFRKECDPVYGLTFLTVELPGGRKLYYPEPHLQVNKFDREAIHYKGLNVGRWCTLSTYGGKLVENITQAVARDCLAEAIERLDAEGYRLLMHIHDEVVLEVPTVDLKEKGLDHVNRIMCQTPSWAEGLLLNAAGFISPYYMKD